MLGMLRQKMEVIVAEKRPIQLEFRDIIREYDSVVIGILHSINQEILKNSKLKFAIDELQKIGYCRLC